MLRKRAMRRYVMIALAMGTVGFLMMLVEEMFDHSDEHIKAHDDWPFAGERSSPSPFSDHPPKKQSGGGTQQNLSPEDLKKMKKAAEMLGIIK